MTAPKAADVSEKAAALFEYLTKLVELKSRPIRDISEYDEYRWFADIPDEPEVTSAVGTVADVDDWLSVRRPRLPEAPELPPDLRAWVDGPGLDPSTPPEFREERVQADGTLTHPDSTSRASWGRYREAWERWSGERRRVEPVFDLYQTLFDIHQRSAQLGEQYEVVIGLGLLFTPTSTGPVRRHVFTARGKVTYEATTGRLALIPDPDGVEASIETDMLDAVMTTPADVAAQLRQDLASLGTALLDIRTLEPLLSTWINSVSSSGAVSVDLAPPATRPTEPAMVFAPAIILRRRTQRSLIAFYRALITQFRDGAQPPALVRGLVEILEAEDQRPPTDVGEDVETYFPLPANDEQQRIVERLRLNRGVAVAGPPGTGKSHTIANLVADALAHGRRVVVTSHTSRALEILVEKLPDDIRDLCVIMAGEGRGLNAELRRSVDALLNRSNDPVWTPANIAKRLKATEGQLARVEKERSDVLSERRRLRESASESLVAPFGEYRGTLGRIAEQLEREATALGWIPDDISADPPMTDLEALEWLALERTLMPEDLVRAGVRFGDESAIPEPADFKALVEEEAEAVEGAERAATHERHPQWDLLKLAGPDQRSALRDALGRLRRERDQITDDREPWIEEAITDVLAGREQPWIARERALVEAIATLEATAPEATRSKVTGLDGVEPRLAKGQVQALAAHVDSGKGFGLGPFQAKAVKDAAPIIASVRVDGVAPKSAATISPLLAHLICLVALDDLQGAWGDRIDPNSESLQVTLAHLSEVQERLPRILALQGPLEAARATAASIDDLVVLSWTDRVALRDLELALGAMDARRRLENARRRLDLISDALRPAGGLPEVTTALEVVAARDVNLYPSSLDGIRALQRLRADVHRRDERFDAMATVAPSVAGALRDQPEAAEWNDWLADLQHAWAHARVVDWVRKQSSDGGANELDARLARLDVRHRQLVAQVGALKAWGATMGRLTQAHKANLQAYKMAIRDYGKGQGKFAASHLRKAQEYMRACVDAVPAWVMPMYRLADSLGPELEPFDLAIVDEASQSGVDGLFVWALAKQVVVVGDDQQISPDAIGVKVEEVMHLQTQLIPNIPFNNLFTPTTSIFDQALLRYPGQLQLREHFRCMPEIIKFSNDLSYAGSPLQPVRQFGSDRLDPLVAVHVEGAETKDNVNRVEAMAIVERIAECCSDPRYRDASFGVISLTGDRQAKFIQRRLIERIGPDLMLRHRIKCGDAYAFQGDQRRVMFLSMVASPTADGHRLPAQVAKGIQQRFNVAASRAEDQAWLFHSVTLSDLNPECLRHKLLSHFHGRSRVENREAAAEVSLVEREDPFESLFEQRVYRRIVDRGYDVMPQHEVLGFRIDLVVTGGSTRLAVECDGDEWHGPEQFDRDTARQRDLERCGWTFVRIVESDFYLDPDEAMAPLWQTLERLGIVPPPAIVETVPDALGVESDVSVEGAPSIIDGPSIAVTEPLAGTGGSAIPPRALTPDLPTGAETGSDEPLPPDQQDVLGLPELPPPAPAHGHHLRPYVAYAPRPMPLLTYPSDAVETAVLKIVVAEGPMTVGRLRRVYQRGIGRTDLTQPQVSAINKTVARLMHERRIDAEVATGAAKMSEWAIRIPGVPLAVLRERGPRALGDIPLSEVAALASKVGAAADDNGTALLLGLYAIPNPTHQQRQYIRRAIDPSSTIAAPAPVPEPAVETMPVAPLNDPRATREFLGVLEDVVNDALALGSRRLDLLGKAWRDDEAVEYVRDGMVETLRDLGVTEDLKSITDKVRSKLPDESGRTRGAVVDVVLARYLERIADATSIQRLTAPWVEARNTPLDSAEPVAEGRCAHGRPWGSCTVISCPGRFLGSVPPDYDWRVG